MRTVTTSPTATRQTAPDTAPHPAPTASKATVPLLIAAALAVLIQLYVSIPLAGPVAAALGTRGVTTALASGFGLCYAIGFLVYGPLSDHFGRRPVLLWGLAVLAAATLAVGFAPSVPVLFALRALQGAAAATFAPTALALLGETLPPAKRAGAIGAMSVAFLAAGIIGQVVAAMVATSFGWRWVFYGGAVVLGALALLLVRVIPGVRHPLWHSSLAARYAHLARFAARPTSLLMSLGHLMILGGFVAMYTLLGPHLAAEGLHPQQVLLARAAALPAMFLSLAAGRLTRRLGAAGCAAIAYGLAAVGLGLEALTAGTPVALTLASVVFVAGVSLAVPTLITLWGEASAPHRGIGMAVNGFVLFLGASLGPYVTGLGGGFARALDLLAIGYLVAGALIWVAARRVHARLAADTRADTSATPTSAALGR